jgi:hypothetical protein
MSKKVIGIIVAAVILIAVTVGILAVSLSKADLKEGKTEIVLKDVNEKILEMKPFNEMAAMDIDSTILVDLFQVDEENVKDYVGKYPMMNVHASMYVIVEAEDGKAEEVKADLDAWAKDWEESWERYLPEQYELVKDRKLGVNGNFVYLIIAESADEIEALLK